MPLIILQIAEKQLTSLYLMRIAILFRVNRINPFVRNFARPGRPLL